ncbi:MAG: phosphonate-binding protein, partial [Alphaproteobacteria bacterium]|nr:phosphonate-binding protein [Alphaproteobacteria bacterium]
LGELGPTAARERAQRRLEAWLAAEAGRALKALRRLKTGIESGALKGLPRGIAYRLVEAGGVIDRREVERDLAALSQVERRTLRTFGVRMGAHSVWLPALLKGRATAVAQAFVAGEPFRPGAATLTPLPPVAPSARLLSAFGLRAVGRFAVGVEWLESLAERRARNRGVLGETDLAELGITLDQAKALAVALKSTRAQQPDRATQAVRPVKDSPFAALSALTAPAPEPAGRKRPRRRKTG